MENTILLRSKSKKVFGLRNSVLIEDSELFRSLGEEFDLDEPIDIDMKKSEIEILEAYHSKDCFQFYPIWKERYEKMSDEEQLRYLEIANYLGLSKFRHNVFLYLKEKTSKMEFNYVNREKMNEYVNEFESTFGSYFDNQVEELIKEGIKE